MNCTVVTCYRPTQQIINGWQFTQNPPQPKETFRAGPLFNASYIQYQMNPFFMMYDNIPWEEILQKKQILFFDSRWKPSERTKWKKMENLYPFLGWKFNLKKNRKVCQRPPMHSRDSTICWIESQQHLNGFKSLSHLLQCWTPGPILLWEDLIGGWCASLPPLHLVFQPAASSRHIFNY